MCGSVNQQWSNSAFFCYKLWNIKAVQEHTINTKPKLKIITKGNAIIVGFVLLPLYMLSEFYSFGLKKNLRKLGAHVLLEF